MSLPPGVPGGAAESNARLRRIIASCTAEGDPVLTRVPPQKASKELAREAVALPGVRHR